jgi:hypothetical protein
MKTLFTMLAAGLLAAAPLTAAKAEDAPFNGGAAAMKAANLDRHATLADGTEVYFDDYTQEVYTMGPDGDKTTVPDGDHVLSDKSVMTVRDGRVTSGIPAN